MEISEDRLTLLKVSTEDTQADGSFECPEGITIIGDSAFSDCLDLLKTITLPEGITTIGDYAFYGCTALTTVRLPEGFTTTGDCTFENCTSLKEVILPKGLTAIGNSAFYGCGFNKVTLPETLITIGKIWCHCKAHCFYFWQLFGRKIKIVNNSA